MTLDQLRIFVAIADRQHVRDSPWVLREAGSGTRSTFEAVLAGWGLQLPDLDIAMVLPGNEAVRSAVEAGAGAAILSHSTVVAWLGDGRLAEVDFDLPARPFHMLRHNQRFRSRAGKAFIAFCTQFVGPPGDEAGRTARLRD